MYIGNKIRRLKTYKNPVGNLMRGSDFKNPIFDPTFDGSIHGPDFGLYGFRFDSSKNSSKFGPVSKP